MGADDPTQPVTIPMTSPTADPAAFEVVFATEEFRVVEQMTTTAEQIGLAWNPDVVPVEPGIDTAEVPMLGVPPGLRMVLVVLASITAVLVAIAPFLTVASYRVTGDLSASVFVEGKGFTSNALLGSILAAVLLLVGAVAGMLGHRFGMGLAGGVGLAVAGLMSWIVGQGVSLIDTVKQAMRVRGGNYDLVTTLDIGWWMAVIAAVFGGVVFVVSVIGIRDDGARRTHPAVGALGVVGTLAVVVGPLLPMHSGTLADNFSSDRAVGATLFGKLLVLFTIGSTHDPVPPITTYLRLLLLLFLGLGGVVGFLMASRWGLGLAVGTMSIAIVQWITSLARAGDLPFGIAGGNPGSDGIIPHVVTSIGVGVVLVAALAQVALTLQSRRAQVRREPAAI